MAIDTTTADRRVPVFVQRHGQATQTRREVGSIVERGGVLACYEAVRHAAQLRPNTNVHAVKRVHLPRAGEFRYVVVTD